MAAAPLPVYLEGVDKITSDEVNAIDLNVTQTVASDDVQSNTATITTLSSTTGTITNLNSPTGAITDLTSSTITATGLSKLTTADVADLGVDNLQVNQTSGNPSRFICVKSPLSFDLNAFVQSYVEEFTKDDVGHNDFYVVPTGTDLQFNAFHLKVGSNATSIKIWMPTTTLTKIVQTVAFRLSFTSGSVVPLQLSSNIDAGASGIPPLNGDEYFYLVNMNNNKWIITRYFSSIYTP